MCVRTCTREWNAYVCARLFFVHFERHRLTRKHSTHAYGFSHARKPGVDLGNYSRLSPGWTLGGEFIPSISMLFSGSFEVVFPFFWSAEGWCGLLSTVIRSIPIGPDSGLARA